MDSTALFLETDINLKAIVSISQL